MKGRKRKALYRLLLAGVLLGLAALCLLAGLHTLRVAGGYGDGHEAESCPVCLALHRGMALAGGALLAAGLCRWRQGADWAWHARHRHCHSTGSAPALCGVRLNI